MFSGATFSLGGPCPAPPARLEEAVLLWPPGFRVHQTLEGTRYSGSYFLVGLEGGGTSKDLRFSLKCSGFSSEWQLAVLGVMYSFSRVPLGEHRLSFVSAVFRGHTHTRTRTCARHCLAGQTHQCEGTGGKTHGGRGKQGPGAQREDDSLGLRAQLSPCGCPLPLSAPCHGPSSRVFVRLLAEGCPACLTSWPLAHVPLIGLPRLSRLRPQPIPAGPQHVFLPESFSFPFFCTEIKHLQPAQTREE